MQKKTALKKGLGELNVTYIEKLDCITLQMLLRISAHYLKCKGKQILHINKKLLFNSFLGRTGGRREAIFPRSVAFSISLLERDFG